MCGSYENNFRGNQIYCNLSRTKSGKYYEKFNYAVAESQEPGSTFKLMSLIATLENDNAISKKLIDTKNGEITFYEKYKVRDSKRRLRKTKSHLKHLKSLPTQE